MDKDKPSQKSALTFGEIKKDLMEIRFYYQRKGRFDKAFQEVTPNKVLLEKVRKYHEIVGTAPAFLYELFLSLYTDGLSQESAAADLGFSLVHINKKHQELMRFLQGKLGGVRD